MMLIVTLISLPAARTRALAGDQQRREQRDEGDQVVAPSAPDQENKHEEQESEQ